MAELTSLSSLCGDLKSNLETTRQLLSEWKSSMADSYRDIQQCLAKSTQEIKESCARILERLEEFDAIDSEDDAFSISESANAALTNSEKLVTPKSNEKGLFTEGSQPLVKMEGNQMLVQIGPCSTSLLSNASLMAEQITEGMIERYMRKTILATTKNWDSSITKSLPPSIDSLWVVTIPIKRPPWEPPDWYIFWESSFSVVNCHVFDEMLVRNRVSRTDLPQQRRDLVIKPGVFDTPARRTPPEPPDQNCCTEASAAWMRNWVQLDIVATTLGNRNDSEQDSEHVTSNLGKGTSDTTQVGVDLLSAKHQGFALQFESLKARTHFLNMEVNNTKLEEGNDSTYDREAELKAFDETKAGVKGLVDFGVTKIPRMFYSGKLDIKENSANSNLSVPIIDLKNIHKNSAQHVEVISQIKSACHEWGFFQVINHGIPITVLDEMIDGIRRFHEQDVEVRKEFYTRDLKNKILYYSNTSLFRDKFANWRDTVGCSMAPNPPKSEELPQVFREIISEYSKKIMVLGYTIFELLSEALGLDKYYLKELNCVEGLFIQGHYYPPCPEPELTMGTSKHTDSAFMTIVLQDQLGGLQVLHQNQWFDVPPVHGIEDHSLLFSLYVFGKSEDFFLRMVVINIMGCISAFNYGLFCWSQCYFLCTENRKLEIHQDICDQKIFTGWIEHELLSYFPSHGSENYQTTWVQLLKKFREGKMSFVECVLCLKVSVGINLLIAAMKFYEGEYHAPHLEWDVTNKIVIGIAHVLVYRYFDVTHVLVVLKLQSSSDRDWKRRKVKPFVMRNLRGRLQQQQATQMPLNIFQDKDGLPRIVVTDPNGSSVEVLRHGGQIISWKNQRKEELLFMSSKANWKQHKAIRGGISACFARFGDIGSLEQNGFTRNSMWSLDRDPSPLPPIENHSYVDLILKSTGVDFKIPLRFELRLRISLIYWEGTLRLEAIWKETTSTPKHFLNSNLEDKVDFNGGGNVMIRLAKTSQVSNWRISGSRISKKGGVKRGVAYIIV